MDRIFTIHPLTCIICVIITRGFHYRFLPIFTDFYLVKIQARISLPKRVNLCSAKDHIVTQLFIHDVHKVWSQWTNFDTLQGKKTDLDYIGKTTSEESPLQK